MHPFPDETARLAEILQKLDAALQEADADVERIDTDYKNAKRYMAQYRGELDPHEMFQNELLLKQTDHTGTIAAASRDRLAKLKDSPYFARIDFKCDDGEEMIVYIGRFTFRCRGEMLIYDWRAPVSGMFYDYETGPAGYDAPAGRIEGYLTRKRQFKIKNCIMEYALESAANIQDDVLQKELSHTSDEKMKSIISTIQKEQNKIIRNENTGTLIIQGAAGSGKTSIALHRIAFLLYRFKDRLSSQNVTILSPNKVFGDYISNVIPELGEEPIYELSFSDIAEIQLEGIIGFEEESNPLDVPDEKWSRRVRFKSTLEFVRMLDAYIEKLNDTIFLPSDYTFGPFKADRDWIAKRFAAYGNYPIKQRLPMIADDICRSFEDDNIMEQELPQPRAVLKSLTSMLAVRSTLALYKNFCKDSGIPHLFVMPSKKTLEWADVYPFLYLHAAFEGLKESRITRHLVIDEMQDYAPIQYAVINLLFPCSKTILGDFGQILNPNHSHTLDDLRAMYEKAEFTELNTSYRSTWEIMNFAKSILKDTKIRPVKRHGKAPSVIFCQTPGEELLKIESEIRNFLQGRDASMGIILKTDKDAEALFKRLHPTYPVELISPHSTSFKNGISITSVRMSKGLEFDAVLIPDAGKETYFSEYDRSLLYIACTRAMHSLTLLHTKEPCCFLPK
ncbi:MAG: HelD family protein [Blautia sp.]|jgi:DNA helicase-2/ATP-dependent DNA helicase PcrA|uniref:HelD family protein n=1 Tax=Blautia sp. TaxID=1955243 RepID=UPI003D8EA793